MPTSKRSIQQQAVDLCWGAWSELGVSGWGRTKQNWAIDPAADRVDRRHRKGRSTPPRRSHRLVCSQLASHLG